MPFILLCWVPAANADWSPLVQRLVADGFDEETVQNLFFRPEISFEPDAMAGKLETLLRRKSLAPALPSFGPKPIYRRLLKAKTLSRARVFMEENGELLEKISRDYCVPREIIVSIILIETGLGKNLGSKAAFNRLASMALCTELETIRPYLSPKVLTSANEELARSLCRRKAEWAYSELIALMWYSGKRGIDPLSLPGSIYGAIGLCQFMPSNIFSYGVDGDQDGFVDPFAKSDALYSIANYLRGHGWKCTMTKSSQHEVIFEYNRSSVYVNTVMAVAEKLKKKPRRR